MENLVLRVALGQIGQQIMETEEEIRDTARELNEERIAAKVKSEAQGARKVELEELLCDARMQLQGAETQLSEATSALQGAAADSAVQRQRAFRAQTGFESELEQKRHEAAAELRHLEERLVSEQQCARSSLLQLERQREAEEACLKSCHEECSAKAALLDRGRALTEEQHVENVASARAEAEQQQKHINMLEQDLELLRLLFAESQANIEWVRQEREREERDASFVRAQLEDELRHVTRSLCAAAGRGEAGVKAFSALAVVPLDDVSRSAEHGVHDAETALVEADHKKVLESGQARLDALIHENDKLRLLLREQQHNVQQGKPLCA